MHTRMMKHPATLALCALLLVACNGGEAEVSGDAREAQSRSASASQVVERGGAGSWSTADGLSGRWMLRELDGKPIAGSLRDKAYLEFLAEGRAEASAGLVATQLQSEMDPRQGLISFDVGTPPILPGVNPVAGFEQKFLDRLDEVSAFKVNGDRLKLQIDGKTALLLEAAP